MKTVNWRHVRNEENPADAAIRGPDAMTLKSSSLWCHGPSWLSELRIPDQPNLANQRSCSLWWTLGISSEICEITSARINVLISGNNVLTYEELSTLLCDIEAILNSRPLLPISTDVLDLRTLTSAMKEMQNLPIPVPPLTTRTHQPFETHPGKRWTHIQKLIGIFWKRWSKE